MPSLSPSKSTARSTRPRRGRRAEAPARAETAIVDAVRSERLCEAHVLLSELRAAMVKALEDPEDTAYRKPGIAERIERFEDVRDDLATWARSYVGSFRGDELLAAAYLRADKASLALESKAVAPKVMREVERAGYGREDHGSFFNFEMLTSAYLTVRSVRDQWARQLQEMQEHDQDRELTLAGASAMTETLRALFVNAWGATYREDLDAGREVAVSPPPAPDDWERTYE